jgi:ATP-dependent Clp protease ATP-binding subunit ClpC
VFERFTDAARRAVVLAQEEARLLNHNYIGTEHILLGLVHEGEGVAARALASLGISRDDVREEVVAIVGEGKGAPAGHVPFTPRAKKVLELALREALQLGHNYIGTEHILLGLVREGEGVAAQVLQRRGANLDRVRQTVMQLLSGYAESAVAAGEATSDVSQRVGSTDHPEAEEEPWRGPLCPSCGAELATSAAYRSITVPDEDDRNGRAVALVFCRTCSRTIGVLPERPGG